MTVEVVTERGGIPIGVATDAANVPETDLAGAALADIPADIPVPFGVPVVADRGYDSDPLRGQLDLDGFRPLAPHRRNRVKPPTNDGRRMRRYKRRFIVERTFAWVHSYRRVVTRFERRIDLYDGFVHLACAFIALRNPNETLPGGLAGPMLAVTREEGPPWPSCSRTACGRSSSRSYRRTSRRPRAGGRRSPTGRP
jgi:transposase